jgi:hypothetical protein
MLGNSDIMELGFGGLGQCGPEWPRNTLLNGSPGSGIATAIWGACSSLRFILIRRESDGAV